MWLKRSTPQNIVIGGAAGAFPPVIGWAAVTGTIDLASVVAVPHHLPVDAAALLGAGAVQAGRLRHGRRADAAERRGRPMRPAPRSGAYSLAMAPVGGAAGAVRHCRRWSTASRPPLLTGALRRACLDGLARARRQARRARPAKALFAYSHHLSVRHVLAPCSWTAPRLALWQASHEPERRRVQEIETYTPTPEEPPPPQAFHRAGGDPGWRSSSSVLRHDHRAPGWRHMRER